MATRVNHPRMTYGGRRLAFVIAVLIAFMLPKRTEHERGRCQDYVLQPWGFYLLGQVFDREIGFAYGRGSDCR